MSTPVEVSDFIEKFEKFFSLMACVVGNDCPMCVDTEAWYVDNGASRNMTGMRQTFLSFIEVDSNFHVGCGANITHAIKGV